MVERGRRYKIGFNILFLGALFVVLSIDCFSQKDHPSIEKLYEKGEEYYKDNQNDSALVLFNKVASLASKSGNDTLQMLVYIKAANCLQRLERYEEAMNMLNNLKAQSYFCELENSKLIAEYYHVLGTTIGDQGAHNQAINILLKSIDAKIRYFGENDTSLAKTYNNIGMYNFYLGHFDEANEYFQLAIEIASKYKKNKSDPDIGAYYQNIGIIAASKGDFEKALNLFTKSLNFFLGILDPNSEYLARIYVNLGRLNFQFSKYQESLKYFDKAEEIYFNNNQSDTYPVGVIFVNKGNLFLRKGNLDKALEYYKKGIQIYRQKLNSGHPYISTVLNNLGAVQADMRHYEEALEYYEQSRIISKDPVSKTIVFRNIAKIHELMGNAEQAEKYYLKANRHAMENLSQYHYELGNSLLSLGDFYLEKGHLDQAYEEFKQALEIFNRNFDFKSPYISKVYLRLGDYYMKRQSFTRALENYHQAIISFLPDFNEEDVYVYPPIGDLIVVNELLPMLIGKSNAFLNRYQHEGNIEDLKASLNAYRSAVRIVDDIRLNLREESMLRYADEVREIFQNAIATCLKLYYVTSDKNYLGEAFEFSEKSRSAVLLASMRDIEAIDIGGLPDSLKQRERKLREGISSYEKLLYDERNLVSQNQSKILLWESKIFDLKQSYDELIESFEKNYPSYFSLKYETRVMNVKSIQENLGNDDVLLEYALQDTTMVLFMIAKNDFRTVSMNLGEDFDDEISFLVDFYQRSLFHHSLEVYNEFLSVSNKLYNKLIGPVAAEIENKNLIIVPDASLNYIPFESLIKNIPLVDLMDYRGLPYLIKEHPVTYSFSATILFEADIPDRAKKKLIAFAPTYSKTSGEIRVSGLTDIDDLDPLQNVEKEVNQITNLIRGTVFSGVNATETNFKENAGEYDILHLAMHTIVDDVEPLYSRLVFTRTQDSMNDGQLYAYELYNLNLNAHMAVLSACNTGYGKLRKGEGVISLARGFIYSGVPSIVMTLWEVEDKSGAEIMTSFYENLETGMSKGKALQQAKLDYLAKSPQYRAHPYFWSAYVTIGDDAPLFDKYEKYYESAVLFFIVLLAGVVLFFYLRKRIHNKKKSLTF
ncbi:MAG: CHAT domain-containing protein [Bacteroidota bacterium]|nr:CHAT domain-containing protein [Bacteroidota bacterium]